MRKNVLFISLFFSNVFICMEKQISHNGPSTTAAMSSVLFSDDQQRIVALNRSESLLQIYAAKAPFSCIKSVENGEVSPFLTSSALAKNTENKIASISYSAVAVRDLATLVKLLTLNTGAPRTPFCSINFNPKNPAELASCYDKVIAIWDIRTGKTTRTFASDEETNQVQYSPDGGYLAFCNNSESKILDLRSSKEVLLLLPGAQHLTYNKTGSQIALAKNALIKTFDSLTGHMVHEIDKQKSNKDLYSLVYSNDGKWLMYGTDDFTLTLACLEDEAKTYSIKNHAMLFNSGEFSKDDSQLLTGAADLKPSPKDTTVRIWDLVARNTNILTPKNKNGWTCSVQ